MSHAPRKVKIGTTIGGEYDLSDRTLQLVEGSNGWPRVGRPNVNKAIRPS
jgi:hypothetical protein